MVVLLIIPVVFFFLILKNRKNEWRESLTISAVFSGLFITGITEILNIFSLIIFKWIVFSWSLLSVGLFIVFKLFSKQASKIDNHHSFQLPVIEKVWLIAILI